MSLAAARRCRQCGKLFAPVWDRIKSCPRCCLQEDLKKEANKILRRGRIEDAVREEADAKWLEESAAKARLPASNEERTARLNHLVKLNKLVLRGRANTKRITLVWNEHFSRFETIVGGLNDKAIGPSLDHARTVRDILDPDQPVVIDPSVPKKWGVR